MLFLNESNFQYTFTSPSLILFRIFLIVISESSKYLRWYFRSDINDICMCVVHFQFPRIYLLQMSRPFRLKII